MPTTEQNYSTIVFSPLEQFEVRNLLSFDAPILGDINLSITNIGLYLTIGALIVLTLNILATNYNKIGSNNWSISNESLYATIHSIVVNQINETRGQIYFPFIYTLFIFILINNLIGMVCSRCLYTAKFLIIRQKLQKVYFSCNNDQSNLLQPYFVTGFSDGEACFFIKISPANKMKTSWKVNLRFVITLHIKDISLLESILTFFGVGYITKSETRSVVQYQVSSIKDFETIINHFDLYPLITQKWSDYKLFKQAFLLVKSKTHLNPEGLKQIVSIKASMNRGLSDGLKTDFPDTIPAPRPKVVDQTIHDPEWMTGFISAEGCFFVDIRNSKTHQIGKQVSLEFSMGQHSRDTQLFESFTKYFGCGKVRVNSSTVDFSVVSFLDNYKKIIPFLNKSPLTGAKLLDYLDFCKVAELMHKKEHLTLEGLAKIQKIKNNMNRERKI